MKKDEVQVGASYSAKVGGKTVDVRIDGENARGGWNGTAVGTGKPVRIKDVRQLRGAAGERTVEQAEGDGSGGADGADPDLVPLTTIDKEKKRGGKKGKANAPKDKKPKAAKPAKENKPKAMSCLDAAAEVLKSKGEPMRCIDMIADMKDRGLWSSTAPTPAATLFSALLREITKKGRDSRFRKTDRGHFALKD